MEMITKALVGMTAIAAVDSVQSPLEAYNELGLPGLLIVFLVAVWLDGKRQEKKNDERQEKFLAAMQKLGERIDSLRDWCREKHGK